MPRTAEIAAHYIITHPSRQECAARGQAITPAGSGPWSGTVWSDPILANSNEDPFVWASTWLYSFCKATQLRRRPQSPGPAVARGSILIFADTHAMRQGTLLVDTVFVVDQTYTWLSDAPPLELQEKLGESYAQAHDRHLRFGHGSARQHRGQYTYTCRTAEVYGDNGGFLPLTDEGLRVNIALNTLPPPLGNHITRKIGRRIPPVLLSDGDATLLMKRIWEITAQGVVRCSTTDKNRITRHCC